jgi:hypothetical protein
MPYNRLPTLIKKLQLKRQKEPRKTTEETSGHMLHEDGFFWDVALCSLIDD